MRSSQHDFVLSAPKECYTTQEDSHKFNFCHKEENALNNSPDIRRAADGIRNEGQDHVLRKSGNEKIGEDVFA